MLLALLGTVAGVAASVTSTAVATIPVVGSSLAAGAATIGAAAGTAALGAGASVAGATLVTGATTTACNAATLTATYNDEVLSTENLGTFKGIGKYYLTIANDGKRLKYYDYLISNGFSSSAFDWQDIPFETEGLGSIDSTGFSNIIKPSGDKIELGKIFISRSREKADEVVTISLDLIKELSK